MSNSVKKVLNSLNFDLGKDDLNLLNEKTKILLREIKAEIKKQKIKASVFVGGSFPKKTMVKKNHYDIDVFIRFDKKYFSKDMKKLERVVEKVAHNMNTQYCIVHGSRDYYKINANSRLIYEIIPAIKISKPEQAENVMDLSYFHVSYMNKKLNRKMQREILTAKAFCGAQGVYGAESYIQGFSGYALECLIVYYKTFEKMLRGLTGKSKEIFIDSERHYKNKNDAFMQMNESKLQSPIIVIDPTWKKRNVMASLSFETFLKFQESSREFLRKPSSQFFVKIEHSREDIEKSAKENKGEFVEIILETTKQEGDIAGTKMKKAMRFIMKNIEKQFFIIKKEFIYREGKESRIYLAAKSRRAITLQGPPVKMEKHAEAFKKEHKRTFVKSGKLYAIEPVNESLKEFLKSNFTNRKELNSMSISRVQID